MNNSKQLNEIIKSLYQVWLVRGCKMCSDTNWSSVMDLINMFKHISGINDISCGSGKYYNYINKINDNDLPYRDYDLNIDTEYGKIEGYIRCCSAGTEKDPFSKYDIVVSFWKADNELSESFRDNFHLEDMLEEISLSKNIDDLKRVAKRYVKEVATVGIFLTLSLSVITMSSIQYHDLSKYATENTIEFSESKEENDWSLVTSDVHTTIYHATAGQCNDDFRHTASMFELDLNNPQAHKVIAMERTMMKKYGLHFGDLVKLEGTGDLDGVYQIQDVMNSRFKGENHIDILVNKSMKYGQWWNIKLYKLNNIELAQNLKSKMKPAKNQKSINKRQTQYNNLLADME